MDTIVINANGFTQIAKILGENHVAKNFTKSQLCEWACDVEEHFETNGVAYLHIPHHARVGDKADFVITPEGYDVFTSPEGYDQ